MSQAVQGPYTQGWEAARAHYEAPDERFRAELELCRQHHGEAITADERLREALAAMTTARDHCKQQTADLEVRYQAMAKRPDPVRLLVEFMDWLNAQDEGPNVTRSECRELVRFFLNARREAQEA